MSSGTPAARQRARSSVHSFGKYRQKPSGELPRASVRCRLTAIWQFAVLPSVPEYWRATPTECSPFLGNPVSSMSQATAFGKGHSKRSAICCQSGFHSHGLWLTNCCRLCSLPSGRRSAMAPTLLRSPSSKRPRRYPPPQRCRSFRPKGANISVRKVSKRFRQAANCFAVTSFGCNLPQNRRKPNEVVLSSRKGFIGACRDEDG